MTAEIELVAFGPLDTLRTMRRPIVLLLLLTMFQASAIAEDRPPNIVLIISDDQAWTDFGFMGHESIETPRLDRLADESLVFEHGYVPSSLCSPSLASIITGRYPHQHRITGNEPPRPKGVGHANPEYRAAVAEMIALADACPTLPDLLGETGYRSLQTGKWWLGDFRRGGFTHGMTHGDPDRGGRHGDEGLDIGRRTMQPIEEFIEEAGDDPFLVWYAPFLPHTPHDPPQDLADKYADRTDSVRIARYWANCERFDASCGALLDLLERLAPGERKLELFGRPHNVHKGWTTLGNQLGKTCITEPWLREHLLAEGVFVEDDLTKLPTPPDDPIVKPWGGHAPPPKLSDTAGK